MTSCLGETLISLGRSREPDTSRPGPRPSSTPEWTPIYVYAAIKKLAKTEIHPSPKR